MIEMKIEEDIRMVSNQIKEILSLLLPIQNVLLENSNELKNDDGIRENDLALIIEKFELLVNYAQENAKLIKVEDNFDFHQLCELIIIHFSKYVNSNEAKSSINEALISKYLQLLHILSNFKSKIKMIFPPSNFHFS
jgi:hypothetical protein